MVVHRPKYQRAETWKPGLAHRDEVRWPKALVYAEIPRRWTALELKLAAFLALNLDTNNMWSVHRLHIKKAKKALDATKAEILGSMRRLIDDHIGVGGEVSSFSILDADRVTYHSEGTHKKASAQAIPVLDDQMLCWQFSHFMISALAADMEDGYARLHVPTINRLKSFASVRLYAVACFTIHSRAKQDVLTWEASRLETFLGCEPARRHDSLKRSVLTAVSGIKSAGAFHPLAEATFRHAAGKGSGRGGKLETIAFLWYNVRDAHRATLWGREIEALEKQAKEEALELERNPPPLTEQQIYQQKRDAEDLLERRRAEWSRKKEQAVQQWELRKASQDADEIYQKVMAS